MWTRERSAEQCRLRVNSDKAHIEHNMSAHPPIADMEADIDFCRNGPEADLKSVRPSALLEAGQSKALYVSLPVIGANIR